MFKNILVPVNFSKGNRRALDIAVNVAEHDGGVVHLLHVVEVIADTSFDEFKDFYMKLENKAQKDMATLTVSYRNSQVEITPTVVYGDRVQEIMKFADSRNIDLIVMNSHKIDLENPFQGWGTISYKIGILSQCPVMLVK
jgi:nucleotide-binding universal stress UspA family protein